MRSRYLNFAPAFPLRANQPSSVRALVNGGPHSKQNLNKNTWT